MRDTGDALRILVIEDEALLVMDIEMIIEDAGHRMIADVPTVSDLVELDVDVRPDVAFVDLQLARGESGLDAAAHIRRAWPAALIVFVTANPRRLLPDINDGDAVIGKPYEPKAMISTLATISEGLSDPPPNTPLASGVTASPELMNRWSLA